jgi:hypothetical protein
VHFDRKTISECIRGNYTHMIHREDFSHHSG